MIGQFNRYTCAWFWCDFGMTELGLGVHLGLKIPRYHVNLDLGGEGANGNLSFILGSSNGAHIDTGPVADEASATVY